jgi:hypothetical protein
MSGNEIVGSAVPPTGGQVPASVWWPPATWPPRSGTAATGGRRVERTVGIERASVGLVERAVGFGVTIVGLWAGRAVARCVGGAALGGRLSRVRRGVAAAAGRLTLCRVLAVVVLVWSVVAGSAFDFAGDGDAGDDFGGHDRRAGFGGGGRGAGSCGLPTGAGSGGGAAAGGAGCGA